MPPMPSSVWATGICVFSAKARRSSQASATRTPWPARMTGRWAWSISRAAVLSCLGWPSKFGLKPGSPADDLLVAGVRRRRLLLQGVLGDVHVDRAGAAGARDVEGLGEDSRQLVGVAHQVVVLGHRQRDAGDVDLLEGVLADERGGHVAGDGHDRDGVELRGGQAGDQVRGAGTGGAHADPDPAGRAGVAIGRVGRALLVADEDVAELRVVAEDVVERQDHATGIAEQDVRALAEERLAARRRRRSCVRPRGLASWSICVRARSTSLAAFVPAAGTCRPVGPFVIVIVRSLASGADRGPWWLVVGRSWWLVLGSWRPLRSGNKRPSPPGEGPVGPDVVPSLAAFSSSPSGLPPGAGNEADQAKKAEADESEEVADGEVIGGERVVVADRHAAAIRRDDDGDQILARVPLTHDHVSRNVRTSPGTVRGV